MLRKLFIFSMVLSPLLTQAQEFGWVKQVTGANNQTVTTYKTDPQGNIYVSGEFSYDVDFGVGVPPLSAPLGARFLAKLTPAGDVIWAKAQGNHRVMSMRLDTANNLYLAGYFQNTFDIDPGPGVFELVSGGSETGFICKLDSAGTLIWAKSFGPGYSRIHAIDLDAQGGIAMSGVFLNTVDFDPGPGVANLAGNIGNPGLFVAKWDNDGNYLWAKPMGNTGYNDVMGLTSSPDGYIYSTGAFSGTSDFNPGPAVYNLVATANSYDIYISKISPNGDFVWAKKVGGNSYSDKPSDIVLDNAGNVCVTGNFYETTDMDPGTGVVNLSAYPTGTQSANGFVLKLSPAGNFIWVKQHRGVSSSNYISIDPANNLYITGTFSNGALDLDPNAGQYLIYPSGSSNTFFQKLDEDGNMVWGKQLSSNNPVAVYGQTINHQGDIIIGGTFSKTVDFDMGPASYPLTAPLIGSNPFSDGYILKLDQDVCSDFTMITDSVSDVTCQSDGHIAIHAEQGLSPYTYAWTSSPTVDSSAASYQTDGIYQVTVTDAYGCSRSRSFVIGAPGFGAGFDLNTNLVTGTFRPGFSTRVEPDVFNDGCTPMPGTLRLVLDSLLTFENGYPYPSQIIGDTLIWNTYELRYDSLHFVPVLYVHTSPLAQIGQMVLLTTLISPMLGDSDQTNNIKPYSYPIINGYDPNDKQVYPKGECTPGYIQNDQLLTYTVRFQNTGNADAINIHIIDSLSPALDLSTVRVIGKSHPMYTEVLPGNKLNFVFDSIHLPDSNSNEPQSHGYVIYEVMPVAGLPVGTHIPNKADIYFDYNPAVITNTVLNTISGGNLGITQTTFTQQACESYTLNGHTYQASGMYQQTYSNLFGCDSTVTLYLTLTQPNGSQLSQTACGSYSLNGQTYTASGNYTQAYTNVQGCDSTVSLALVVLQPTASSFTQEACENYTWNGQTYTGSGTYTQTLSNAQGCDSTVTLHLAIHGPTVSSLTESACESYTLNAQTYTGSGTYTQTLSNTHGCDSTVTLHLTIHSPTVSLLTESACESYTLNGQTYTSSGTYTQTLSNTHGCDSVVTLSLTIVEPNTSVTQNGFTLTANAAGNTYQWINCSNNSLISGATGISYSPVTDGNYAVIVTQNGCSDTSACYAIAGMGISENGSSTEIHLYPNPAQQQITLQVSSEWQNSVLRMVNLTGQTVYTQIVSGQQTVLDVAEYAAGVYWMEITQNNQIHRIKWIKQ